MAKSLISHVMDLNKSGTAFTDSLFADIGATAITFRELKEDLGHDFFTQEDLIIRTASGGGGTLLVETTDYTLSEEDTLLSSEVTAALGATRHVYKKIQIINASYQTGSLYVSGKWVADGIDMSFYNCISPIVVTKSASYTITDTDYYKHYMVTTGTATKIITLPTVADNKHLRIKITKADTGYGPVLVDAEGSETIIGITHFFLWSQYDSVELMSTGSEWIITNGFLPYIKSGFINTSDATNRHFGTVNLALNNIVGTPIIGDKVLGATVGTYGIVIGYSNPNLYIGNIVGGGGNIFNAAEALSFDLSGATASVNSGNFKNSDTDFYHGFGITMRRLVCQCFMSTDKTEANTYDIFHCNLQNSAGSDFGMEALGVDTNNLIMHTAKDGGIYITTATGAWTGWTSGDYYYEGIVKLQ